MLPLRDNVPTRSRPLVTWALVAANVLVWVLDQLPDLERSVVDYGYQPCEVTDACRQIGEPWVVNIFTSMFLHGGWEHLLGNMLFLWIFGNNVEDAMGRVRFLAFYVVGGLAATAAQTVVTLHWGSAADAAIPNVGASGAIAAVLGAYFVLLPHARVLTWIVFVLREIPAFVLLGIWFLFQLWSGSGAVAHPEQGGGVAFFAHVGGFVFGLALVRLFAVRRPLEPSYG